MKKIVLFILSFILLFSLYSVNLKAEDEWVHCGGNSNKYVYKDDTYYVDYKAPFNLFRLNKNNLEYIEFSVDAYTINFLSFTANYRYAYVYGSITYFINKEERTFGLKPILFKFDIINMKLVKTKIYDDCIYSNEYNNFVSNVYEVNDMLYCLYALNIRRDAKDSYGTYKLCILDSELEIVKYKDIETYRMHMGGVYDYVHVQANGIDTYYNSDLEEDIEYYSLTTYNGYFDVYTDMYIDGTLYEAGQSLNTPGLYKIQYKNYLEKEILIEPIIKTYGEKDGDAYKDYFDYRVSGGDVLVNGKSSYLNGTISGPGTYEFIIYGKDGYEYRKTITIEPRLLSYLSEDDPMNIGDVINFSGEATINNKSVDSGYVISESGTYTLDLYLNGNVYKSYTFTVDEEVVTVKEKADITKILTFVLGGLILILLVVIIIKIIKRKRNKIQEMQSNN